MAELITLAAFIVFVALLGYLEEQKCKGRAWNNIWRKRVK